jgi:hypothetical protein
VRQVWWVSHNVSTAGASVIVVVECGCLKGFCFRRSFNFRCCWSLAAFVIPVMDVFCEHHFFQVSTVVLWLGGLSEFLVLPLVSAVVLSLSSLFYHYFDLAFPCRFEVPKTIIKIRDFKDLGSIWDYDCGWILKYFSCWNTLKWYFLFFKKLFLKLIYQNNPKHGLTSVSKQAVFNAIKFHTVFSSRFQRA